MFKKTCVGCGLVVEYEDDTVLEKTFYKKGGYFLNTCKDCEKSKHKSKYKSGIYGKKPRFYEPSTRVVFAL